MNETKNNTLGKVTGLWQKTDKNGDIYFTGSFSQISVIIFKNGKKQKDSDPDYNLFFDKQKPRQQREENNDCPF